MAKKTKTKQKSKKQLKALRELHNIVTQWTDKDFEKKGPFSEYCEIQRKKNKKMNQLLTDADLDNLSIASLTNYLEDNSFRDEEFDEEDIDYKESKTKMKKKGKKKKQKKSKVKKPLTAYNYFCYYRGPEIRRKYAELTDHDFWAALADEWKKLDENDKKIYIQLSEKDKKRYQNEVNEGKNGVNKKVKRKKSKFNN